MSDLITEQSPAAEAEPEKPAPDSGRYDGTIAAALIACGIACLVFGLAVLLVEHVEPIKKALTLSEAAGPLSGKAVVASLAYAVAWPILHVALRGRDLAERTVLRIALPLIAVGFVLTFPPIYMHLWF